jgi:hypothetical protein
MCNVITVRVDAALDIRADLCDQEGRTVTSRSGGAIEGAELPSPCPRYVRRGPTVADASSGRRPLGILAVLAVTAVATFTAIAVRAPSRSLVTFTAIRGDHLRRDQQIRTSITASVSLARKGCTNGGREADGGLAGTSARVALRLRRGCATAFRAQCRPSTGARPRVRRPRRSWPAPQSPGR